MSIPSRHHTNTCIRVVGRTPHPVSWNRCIRTVHREPESAQRFCLMVQHPCSSRRSRAQCRQGQPPVSKNLTQYRNVDKFPLKPAVSLHKFGLITGIEQPSRGGYRIKKPVADDSVQSRIAAGHQRSLVDPGFRREHRPMMTAMNPVSGKPGQIRHQFRRDHVRTQGVKTDDQKSPFLFSQIEFLEEGLIKRDGNLLVLHQIKSRGFQ